MPIYEFSCDKCRTIFSFLSRRVNTEGRPPCPRCGRTLSRQISLFAAVRRGRDEGEGDEENLPADEPRLEQAMAGMADEIEKLDEENPRQAARLMRKLAAAGGLRFNPAVEEAIARMEAGEDPEALEAEFGDAFEEESPFAPLESGKAGAVAAAWRRRAAPRRDPTLHEM